LAAERENLERNSAENEARREVPCSSPSFDWLG